MCPSLCLHQFILFLFLCIFKSFTVSFNVPVPVLAADLHSGLLNLSPCLPRLCGSVALRWLLKNVSASLCFSRTQRGRGVPLHFDHVSLPLSLKNRLCSASFFVLTHLPRQQLHLVPSCLRSRCWTGVRSTSLWAGGSWPPQRPWTSAWTNSAPAVRWAACPQVWGGAAGGRRARTAALRCPGEAGAAILAAPWSCLPVWVCRRPTWMLWLKSQRKK